MQPEGGRGGWTMGPTSVLSATEAVSPCEPHPPPGGACLWRNKQTTHQGQTELLLHSIQCNTRVLSPFTYQKHTSGGRWE